MEKLKVILKQLDIEIANYRTFVKLYNETQDNTYLSFAGRTIYAFPEMMAQSLIYELMNWKTNDIINVYNYYADAVLKDGTCEETQKTIKHKRNIVWLAYGVITAKDYFFYFDYVTGKEQTFDESDIEAGILHKLLLEEISSSFLSIKQQQKLMNKTADVGYQSI